jgi:hypothetical protein
VRRAAATDGEHGPDGAIEIVRHARRLVDEQQVDAGKGADRLFASWQGHEPRAVGQLELALVRANGRDGLFEVLIGMHDLAKQLMALPLGRRDEQDE